MTSRTIFEHRHFRVFSCFIIRLSLVMHWHGAGWVRTARDDPGLLLFALALEPPVRTRRRWRRCPRRLLPARSAACRSWPGRAGPARRRVRHPGDWRGQVPDPHSHQHGADRARSPVRQLFVTAAGLPVACAADLVRHMANRYRPPVHCAAPAPWHGQIRRPP